MPRLVQRGSDSTRRAKCTCRDSEHLSSGRPSFGGRRTSRAARSMASQVVAVRRTKPLGTSRTGWLGLSVRWRPVNRMSSARARCRWQVARSAPPVTALAHAPTLAHTGAMKATSGASPAASVAARESVRASNSQASNHSIERTNNSGRRLLASAKPAALLFAAHVER